ncbi:MAG: hypothetical protein COB85_01645 [Bacteroidetes bacterium]|nr:MAG: hypothetical protein COB85_01645 [Bacteroidota bacterium]
MNKIALLLSAIFLISSILLGQTAQTFTFTIEGMTCNSCANTATKVLQDLKGVESATVDYESKTATLSGKVTQDGIRAVLTTNTNFEALFEGESLVKALTDKERSAYDIKTIKGGHKMKFMEHLSSGKITVFDFYAEWCGPCRVFSPKVERMLLKYDNVALRKVDIVDWKSPLSKQLTKAYKFPALPFTLIFDAGGKLLGKVKGNNIEMVEDIINRQ